MVMVRDARNGYVWDVPDAVGSGLVASGDVEYYVAPEETPEPEAPKRAAAKRAPAKSK